MQNLQFSIILPVYNQADHIVSTIEQYEQALSQVPITYEIILVVNACKDQSLSVCQNLAKKYPSIKVIHSEHGGWGFAVKLGLKESKGNFVCYTNSARTQAKDLVLALLYAMTNPDCVIKANRKIRDGLTRRVGSLLYNIECRTLFDLSNWDVNGTPKVFPRKFDQLFKLTKDNDLIDLEFSIVCRKENYSMLEIPTFSPRRHSGRSTTGYQSALAMYWGAFQFKRLLKKNSSI